LGALFVQGAVGLVYQWAREIPKPKLFIHTAGEGAGTVISAPDGIDCGDKCVVGFEPGTTIRLTAVLQDGSTFEGWSKECATDPEWPLDCTLVLNESTHVTSSFGLVPEEVNVAWATAPDDKNKPAANPVLDIRLPDPEEEAEHLADNLIPLDELLVEPAPPDIPLPQPLPQPPPETQPPQEKPKEVAQKMPQMKAVEVPDENEVEQAPDDAEFLSDKNRDVLEQSRAEDTNLEKQQDGEQAFSEQSDIQSDEIGAEEDDIAQMDDVDPTSLDAERNEFTETRGRDDYGQVPRGEGGDEGEGGKPEKPGMLAMRGIEGRGMPGGSVTILPDEGDDGRRPGRRGKRGIKTQLEFDDYENIVGKEVAANETELGRKRQSKHRGRWEKKQAAVRAALENFIPEVKPGNQTALKTRAAPFAVYIARMHRKIHELWGFGFLEELDGRSSTDPLNNWSLETVIEVSVNPDGTINKTTIVKPSGVLRFDVAAIDVLLTAAPFEPTPEKIRSVDGRVWIHWTFRRDWEQCGTFNTRMFILSEVSDSRIDDGEMVRNMRPSRKRGMAGDRRPEPSRDARAASARAHANLPAPDDPEAEYTANMWVSGFAHGNVAKMLKVTGAPFISGKQVVANSVAEVGAVYKNILRESRGQVSEWKLLSPAGYRKRFGALPEGIDLASDQLLMVVRVTRERFTLVLNQTAEGKYRVTGFYR